MVANISSPLTQIVFFDRKKGDIGNDCLLLVDGTDFCLAMGYNKDFWLYKFKKSGLWYKIFCVSKQETFAGGAGLIHLVYGTMVLYSKTDW